jgi:uncharacterized protein (DUF1778 family)
MRKMTKPIRLQISKADKLFIKRAAKKTGISTAKFIRDAAVWEAKLVIYGDLLAEAYVKQ